MNDNAPNWRKARLRSGTSLGAMRQKTRDALDRDDEQAEKYGPRNSAAILTHLDSQTTLAKFDEMVVLEAIRNDPGCKLVSRMLKCSLDEAAERMMALVKEGYMTVGEHEGKIRVGITTDGWKAVARKLR